MLQNKFRKELKEIQSNIDEQMTKIDKLLQRLLQKQQQCLKKPVKQLAKLQTQWSDEEQVEKIVQYRLNETCQETQYYTSRMNLSYNFQCIWEDCQEILLDNYNQYDSRYIKEIFLNQPKKMTVLTKNNWINNYLDEADTKVMFELEKQRKIIKDIAKGFVKYVQYDKNEDSTQKFIESQAIYSLSSLEIEFPLHMKGYELNLKVGQRNVLYQITMNEKGRILIECPNLQQKLIRFLIIKAQNQQKDIIWGAYSYQTILESLILQTGKYILMPLPGDNTCNLYFQNSSSFLLKKDYVHSLKSFTLLKNTFEECRQFATQSTNSVKSDQEDIQKQFMRSCYMNFGLVLEIYQNIYQHQARFIDQQASKEDIQLLFQEIYSADQIDNRFSPGQRCIKFYIITQKPANLFIPNKKVLMGNRYMENQIYHAVFK